MYLFVYYYYYLQLSFNKLYGSFNTHLNQVAIIMLTTLWYLLHFCNALMVILISLS